MCIFTGVCKDTVASISEPVQKNTYGLSDGAWMRDARGHGNVIYLTSGHYGNNLLEFRDMDTFKLGTEVCVCEKNYLLISNSVRYPNSAHKSSINVLAIRTDSTGKCISYLNDRTNSDMKIRKSKKEKQYFTHNGCVRKRFMD